ncbi:Na+/H+ antiporter subunit E [Alphaproteobacteria bacterium LSUCC0684]
MLRTGLHFVILMLLWLLMSGHYTVLVTGLGVVSVAFAVLMAKRINAADAEGLPLHMVKRLPGYSIWLFREILMSNIATARVILGNRPDPEIFHVPYSQKTPAGVAAYANSITLTPGTVTVDIDETGFLVHALDGSFGDDVRSGEMDRRMSITEGGAG